MAADIFLKVDGIPGESKDSKHTDWIELKSFDIGVEQPVSRTASSAGGATAERANFDPVTVIKETDLATPKLLEADYTGKHIKEIIIEACRAGGDKQKYLEVRMEQVIVSSFKLGCSDGNFSSETI